MLKDTIRTDAYRDFIYAHKDLFAGKTVLDIGCGTGILSLFCAKAGAARVIAVDRSDIIDKARENVFRNGLGDVITCLRGKIEEVSLPVDKVDIIVSEWMGYCLLFEAMLPSVLWARDRYLTPDGLLVPSHANLWIAPFAESDYIPEQTAFWTDVYGFDMTAMQPDIYADVRVEEVPEKSICGTPNMFRMLDLHTVKTEELVFTAPWQLKLNAGVESMDGFVVWFDIFFGRTRVEHLEPTATALAWKDEQAGRIAFTTGPFGKPTHWFQGLFLSRLKPTPEELKKAESVSGDICFATHETDERALTLKLEWVVSDDKKNTQSWTLR
jgi:predicted RNA methylase